MNHLPNTSIMNTQATATGDCERPPLARTNAMTCSQIQYHPIETLPIPRIFCPLKREISDISIESILLTSLDDNYSSSSPTKYHQYDRHGVQLTSGKQECTFQSNDADTDDDDDDDGNTCGSNNARLECTITGLSNMKHIQRPFQLHQDKVSAQPLRHCSRHRSLIDEKQNTVFVDQVSEKVIYAPSRKNSLRDAFSYSNMYETMLPTTSFHKVFCETQADTIPIIPLRKSSFIEEK